MTTFITAKNDQMIRQTLKNQYIMLKYYYIPINPPMNQHSKIHDEAFISYKKVT